MALFIPIHTSGHGAAHLRVDSYHNGAAYNVSFGEAGSPMLNVFLQDDDAAQFRADWDAAEADDPERETAEIIRHLLDDHL